MSMNELNPVRAAQVKALGTICCRKLDGESFDLLMEAMPVIDALVRSGYFRLSNINLQARVESTALDDYPAITLHRRAELTALAGQLQTAFKDLVERETRKPQELQRPVVARSGDSEITEGIG